MTIYRLFPLISRLDWMTGASVILKQSYDARIVGKTGYLSIQFKTN